VLCYDPDRAGQTAAERSSELLVAEGFVVNVISLPGGGDPDTFLQKQGKDAFVAELKRSRPYLEFLLDRAAAEHDLSRDDSRRAFLSRMLGVAARIPDPAVRDQFADRLAHKARVTEAVVRSEIRKAAAERKTELPAERLPSLVTRLRPAEKGLLWTLIHQPVETVPWLRMLQPEDIQGLRSENVLRIALSLDISPEDVPAALMERLSTQEAEMLAAIAAEASSPVLRPDVSVFSLKRLRLEREQAEVQREIDRLQAAGEKGADLTALLRRKMSVQRELEAMSRSDEIQ
jgi:DNA primase